ncbi:MAG: type II secretion system F family protein [Vulcanimicrobiaceae bacterium]
MIENMAYAIAASGAGSALLLAISAIPAESPIAARLKKMERINTRSVSERTGLIEQILGSERQSRLQKRLIEAGWYHLSPLGMRIRSLGALGGGTVVGFVMMLVFFGYGMLTLAGGVLTALLAWRMPNIMLSRAIVARKEALQRSLPDFLDVLAATVQAGLALNGALVQAVDATQGPLKQELESMLAEVRLGRQRGEALLAMAERVNEDAIATMVTAIVQAERLGSNLTDVLHELAKESRDRRWLRAEERASHLPIKMILPMALFMIPSLYVMIFGPVVARLAMPR